MRSIRRAAKRQRRREVRIEPSAIPIAAAARSRRSRCLTCAKHAGNIRVLAGGTDLIPSMRQKLFEPEYVLDLRGIAELRGIRPQPTAASRSAR